MAHAQTVIANVGTGKDSYAYWSDAPAGKAIVFVHGFLGTARDAWRQFDSLLQAEAACDGADIFFYGYDGVTTHATESGEELNSFLDELIAHTQRFYRWHLPPKMAQTPERQGLAYTRVVLVAHSLGAVVSRIALLGAYHDGAPWLDTIRLVLFAPAHGGTRTVDAIVSAVSGINILGAAVAIGKAKVRAAADLQEDSIILEQLRSEVASLADAGRAKLAAKCVVWARGDDIVINKRFPGDPKPVIVNFSDHRAVCKPTSSYKRPVEEFVVPYLS
jgi:pimeloyl-ACP methyl ester carboxylesterase